MSWLPFKHYYLPIEGMLFKQYFKIHTFYRNLEVWTYS